MNLLPKPFLSLLLLGLLMVGVSLPALAMESRRPNREPVAPVVADRLFSEAERALVRNYYRDHLPPGLAKKERLPPGLQKQLERKGQLPPGLSGERLPDDLERRLDPLPDGYRRLRVGDDVVLIDQATRLILDVIHGVGQ